MKVLSKEQAEILEEAGLSPKKQKRRRRYQRKRRLRPAELEASSRARRRRLENQGLRPNKKGLLLPPGLVVSAMLAGCGHRARVEVLSNGYLPARAKCPTCRRWGNTLAETARKPLRSATRTIVDERVEMRDGRVFTVKVLGTPARARRAS
jgi:hypothetical protein